MDTETAQWITEIPCHVSTGKLCAMCYPCYYYDIQQHFGYYSDSLVTHFRRLILWHKKDRWFSALLRHPFWVIEWLIYVKKECCVLKDTKFHHTDYHYNNLRCKNKKTSLFQNRHVFEIIVLSNSNSTFVWTKQLFNHNCIKFLKTRKMKTEAHRMQSVGKLKTHHGIPKANTEKRKGSG